MCATAKNYQLEYEILLLDSLVATSCYEECSMIPCTLIEFALIFMKDFSAGRVPRQEIKECQKTETCMCATAKNYQLEYEILFG